MMILWKKYSYVMIFIAISLLIGVYSIFSLEDDSKDYQQIIVSDGQSLWELAQIYAEEHSMNPQDFIEWVTNKNHLSSSRMVKTGDKIVIPVKVKKQLEDDSQLAFDLE